MSKLRRLSGDDVIRILGGFGFVVIAQRGSHAKLRRVTEAGEKQALTVPGHRQLDTGRCRAILRQASRYIAASELTPLFYTG